MPIDKPTQAELAKWNKILKYHRLGMDRGATLGGQRFIALRENDGSEELEPGHNRAQQAEQTLSPKGDRG